MRPIVRAGVFLLSGLLAPALPGAGQGSPFPQASQGGVPFVVDGAAFRADSQGVRQEIYYSLPATSLAYLPGKVGGYRAVYTTEVVLRDSSGSPRGTNSWKSENGIASVEEAKSRQMHIANQVEFHLAPGLWQLTVTIRDSASGQAGVVSIPLRVSAFPARGLAISDLEFSADARSDTGSSMFTKNTYRVTPEPDHRFGGRLPFLYWYCELYNLSRPASGKGTFRIDYAILDSAGKAVQEVSGEVRQKPGASVVEVGGIPVAGLSPGKYRLRLVAFDLDSKSQAEREGTFEKAPLEMASSAPAMGPEVQAYYDQIQYLTTPDTVKFFRALSPGGKKQFLEDFWKRHDLSAFVANMRYVDEHFSSGFRRGRQSDRGRVFLKYGKPDEVVAHPADESYAAHEIWYYYSQGGKQFVFSDLAGYGRYEQVYSSVSGESTNPKWQTLFDQSELHQ